ncbi:type VI secretion system Vgr family protein [Chondromyces crocatus]|uniref:Type IV secretion protein Rhs n=1 Tax=Chondromyces crocatus TaxID=52 RepID=A0A0K1EQF1_CHOCO|nr:type VI secretion system tip protein TssI/VgrG [Chondromyces crocatus]AKT42887.1 type IV secretion protein Rhs [Chondromyces crocatus]
MTQLALSVASGDDLSVRRFSAQESVSSLFTVSIWARSENAEIDLEAIVGKPASLSIVHGVAHIAGMGARQWQGVCAYAEQIQAEPTGLSTYYLRIVPRLYLLTQRRNYRVFQHLNIPDIVEKLLGEWNIEHVWKADRGRCPKLEYKVQYGETDHAFVSRLLEEAGIAFVFADPGASGTKLTLDDKLHAREARPTLPYVDNPSQASEQEFVTRVRLAQEVRSGAATLRDYDFRNPGFPLFAEAPKMTPEDFYEQYRYTPGGFLIEQSGKDGGTPVADDQGTARYVQDYGKEKAERLLRGHRAGRRMVNFDTNAFDLYPGSLLTISNHPHEQLGQGERLLVLETNLEGSPDGEWTGSARAVFASEPYLPPQRTPKPEVTGVQTATVVGPQGQEIHTDEFGRVRIQFPWDREGKYDEHSSCWVRVSQGWAGTGYGMLVLPRIGQEVLIGFLQGDADQPVVVGRVFNAREQVPYKLPDHKTRSTWKSDSSMGSGGFNEIMFEDLKANELIYMQAEKDLRKLVKNDETITVGHNRQKYVVKNETETTGANRTEVTGANRTEVTEQNRLTIVGVDALKLVRGDEYEKTDGKAMVLIRGNQDVVVKEDKRERVEGSSHLKVSGKQNGQIDGKYSLTVGKDQHIKVAKNHALDVSEEIHLKAGTSLYIEATKDLTLKGPGGFIRIDSSGVTIRGTKVRINSGGSAGSGSGASPEAPEEAIEAEIEAPQKPVPENVAVTGITGAGR